jgi:hypothetical protein
MGCWSWRCVLNQPLVSALGNQRPWTAAVIWAGCVCGTQREHHSCWTELEVEPGCSTRHHCYPSRAGKNEEPCGSAARPLASRARHAWITLCAGTIAYAVGQGTYLVEIAPRSATVEDRDSKLRAPSCMEKRTECLVAADFHEHKRASEAKLLANGGQAGRRWALGVGHSDASDQSRGVGYRIPGCRGACETVLVSGWRRGLGGELSAPPPGATPRCLRPCAGRCPADVAVAEVRRPPLAPLAAGWTGPLAYWATMANNGAKGSAGDNCACLVDFRHVTLPRAWPGLMRAAVRGSCNDAN